MTEITHAENALRNAISYLRERGIYCLDKKAKKIKTQREFWRRVADHLDRNDAMDLMVADPRYHGPDHE